MNNLKQQISEFARKCGADLVGYSNVGRFDKCPALEQPCSIYPETKTVIGFAFRVLRGSFRGVEEGSTYYQYYTTAVETIEEAYMPKVMLQIAGFMEDLGYDAVIQKQNQLIMHDVDNTNPEVVHKNIYRGIEGEYQLNFKKAAVLCGLGEMGYSGSVLTDEYGPLQRFAFILSNAEIDPDDIQPRHLCDQCGMCISACPGKAYNDVSSDLNLSDMTYKVREFNNWQCAAYYKGASGQNNPFMPPDGLTGIKDREEILEGNRKMNREEAMRVLDELVFYPPGRHSYVPSICGKACDLACYCHLEELGKMSRKYKNGFKKREHWKLELDIYK